MLRIPFCVVLFEFSGWFFLCLILIEKNRTLAEPVDDSPPMNSELVLQRRRRISTASHLY
uniref:Uncharacterized protein n=1 Tax=Anguilla anguilla TaxID=7936 RepID=A0A0E9U4Z8_ANGAN